MSKTDKITALLNQVLTEVTQQPKLLLKPIDGKLLMCDESGQALPMQGKLTLRQDAQEFVTATVEFGVDGNQVRFYSDTE